MAGTKKTTSEVAQSLNISVQAVRTLCRTGKLKAERMGRQWLVDANDARAYGLKSGHNRAKDHSRNPSIETAPIRPVALSFFSGAMGLDLGLEAAGFDIRLACEVDKHCRQTIELNKPDIALLGNVSDCSPEQVRLAANLEVDDDIELMVGGPPCQAFSTAGKRKAFNDKRGNVFLDFVDLCLELRPKYIVIENVRGLLSCPMMHRPHQLRGAEYPDLSKDEMKGGALNYVLGLLETAGYSVSFDLYNSANFGTPQTRERVIIVCARDGGKPAYLQPTHSQDGSFGLPKWRTVREAIEGKKTHHHLNFPEKRLKYYRKLKAGQNWRNLPLADQKEAMGNSFYSGGGKTGFFRRLAWDKPSPTLVTHPAMPATDLAHPEEDRPLSIEEYKAIQQFPTDWELAGPLTEQYKQVGNAVPFGLGLAVGRLINQLLLEQTSELPEGFKFSRYKNTNDVEWRLDFDSQYAKEKAQSNQMSMTL